MAAPPPSRSWAKRFVNERSLTVVTWNCLAQSLASGFDDVPEEALAWEHRVKLLARELWRCLDTEQPDSVAAVICLQEVDEACVGSLVAEARLGTYECVYVPKGDESGAQRPDGGMLVLHNVARHYAECARFSTTVLVYGSLEENVVHSQRGALIFFGDELCVATTHLKAKPEFRAVRRTQLAQLCAAIERGRTGDGPRRPGAVLIVGDLNDHDVASLLGSQNQDYLDVREDMYDFASTGVWTWTTLKTRGGATKQCDEDYILMGHSIELEGVLSCAELSHGDRKQLLSEHYPSDHIALAARVRF